MRILIAFLFSVVSAYGQIGGIIAATANTKVDPGEVIQYVEIPDAPALVSATTLNYVSGTVTNASLAANAGIIAGSWEILTANALIGTATNHKRLVNQNSSTEVGNPDEPDNHALRTLGSSSYFEVYGLSATAPFYVYDSENGIQISGTSGDGTVFKGVNIVANNIDFAGFFMNSGGTLSGGDANTPPVSTINYDSIQLSFVRVLGTNAEGEGFYLGSTSKTAYGIHWYLSITHGLVTDKGRDGIQLNNIKDATVTNCTVYDVGKLGTAGQQALVQVQNTKAVFENCIFDTAPDFCDIFAQDLVFRNCYFRWDGGSAGFIGDYNTGYNTSSRLFVAPVGILFENCIFDPSVNTTHIVTVSERNANVEFRDCTISHRITTAPSFDNRGVSPSNSLIGGLSTNGNTYVDPATIERPTFLNFNPLDFDNHGKLTNTFYLDLGMGYRTITD